MASQTQYEFFKVVFDEESRRYSELESRARLYLTLITFYLGVLGFKLSDVTAFTARFHVPLVFYLATGGALLLALLATVAASMIRGYERLCDLREVFVYIENSSPTDEEFFNRRLADFAVATGRNVAQNNKSARWLRCAAAFIFLAVSLQLMVILMAIINSRS